jgi:enoyl-CoA hydratase/carnithine racemase
MQLTGERIGAQRAYEIGVVQKIVPREQLLAEAGRIAEVITQNAPLAVQGIKKVVMTARDMPIEYSWKFAHLVEQRVYRSEDFSEGPKAFAEKRKPQWKGR